jgi:osmotically inducible protein OsmC
MAAERRAEATWKGSLFEGGGRVSLVSSGAADDLAVTWAARTEEPGSKTSPEELIAAAHASCFAMSLSNILAQNDTPPERLDVAATSSFEKTDAGFRLTRMHLDVAGTVPSVDADTFQSKADQAKDACPVSNALVNNVEISLTANLK